jgi:hypothetical protein
MSRWCHTTVATQLSSLLITIGQKTLVFKRSDPLNFSCYEALIVSKLRSGESMLEVSAILKDPPR